MGLRLTIVKSAQPSSTKSKYAFQKSFEFASYVCLNYKVYFFVFVNLMTLEESYSNEYWVDTRLSKKTKIIFQTVSRL